MGDLITVRAGHGASHRLGVQWPASDAFAFGEVNVEFFVDIFFNW